jgi:hypothetical protein
MAQPTKPVALSMEQIGELNQKLSALRHDLNNSLSLIAATVALIRHRPTVTEQMWNTLAEQPRKIGETFSQFARDLEATSTSRGLDRPDSKRLLTLAGAGFLADSRAMERTEADLIAAVLRGDMPPVSSRWCKVFAARLCHRPPLCAPRKRSRGHRAGSLAQGV